MTHNEAHKLLRELNALTATFQRKLDIDSAWNDRVDDEVVPMLMDASDALARILQRELEEGRVRS